MRFVSRERAAYSIEFLSFEYALQKELAFTHVAVRQMHQLAVSDFTVEEDVGRYNLSQPLLVQTAVHPHVSSIHRIHRRVSHLEPEFLIVLRVDSIRACRGRQES
jgi:hypothetical protein